MAFYDPVDPLLTRCDELKDQGVDLIRFAMPDLFGRWRGKSVGITCVSGCMKRGLGIFSGAICHGPHYETTHIPRIIDSGCPSVDMKPADTCVHVIPWAKIPTAEIICDPYWSDGSIQLAAPRGILSRQLERLHDMGYDLLSAFESEFSVYHKDTLKPLFEGNAYCNISSSAPYEDFMGEVTRAVRKVNIHVETASSEWSPGQFEFTFKPEWGLKTMDDIMRFRDAVKAICDQRGFKASFMTRPFDIDGGSNSLHFNHSLWHLENTPGTKTNIICSPQNEKSLYSLSDVGRYWVGGLINHIDALTALCSPTVNCYRRLHNPWAPSNKDWGPDNRMAAFRVVGERGGRVENRLLSGSVNPYLAAAATIAAGIDGIQNKTEPPPPGHTTSSPEVSHTLQEALDALTQDTAMVAALGEEFIEWYVSVKTIELEAFQGHHVKATSGTQLDTELAKERQAFFNL